ncbi:MAG: response regulator [Desulfuromonadia bacterium]
MTGRPISILLVEDDELVMECIVAFLEDEGFRVTTASTGEEGLAILRRETFHLCITDMRLKGMDGEAFILEAHRLSPPLRFLIHTGGGYTISDPLREIGMTPDHILRKPLLELSLLSRAIRSLASESNHGTAQ